MSADSIESVRRFLCIFRAKIWVSCRIWNQINSFQLHKIHGYGFMKMCVVRIYRVRVFVFGFIEYLMQFSYWIFVLCEAPQNKNSDRCYHFNIFCLRFLLGYIEFDALWWDLTELKGDTLNFHPILSNVIKYILQFPLNDFRKVYIHLHVGRPNKTFGIYYDWVKQRIQKINFSVRCQLFLSLTLFWLKTCKLVGTCL